MNRTGYMMQRRRRGMTLIEVALSIGVLALILVGLSQLLSSGAEYLKSRSVADRLQQVTAASREYVKANFTELQAAIPVNTSLYVPVTGAAGPAAGLPSLQGGGYLPSTYEDANAYDQRHGLVLRHLPADPAFPGSQERLEGVVTTFEGTPMPDRILGQVAGFMGADAGFMFNQPIAGTENQITGVSGGWRAPAATWTAGVAVPSAGHAMASLAFAEGSLVGDYLNRHDIGVPEANTMRTDLNMGTNNITEVTQIAGNSNTINMGADGVEIGPNLRVAGYITAGTDITAANDVMGKRFLDGDDTNFVVDPASKTTLNELSPNFLNANTLVYNGTLPATGSTAYNNLVRLQDRLPNYVAKQGWYVTASGQTVLQPDCPGVGQPKVTYSAIVDSYRFATNVTYSNDALINNIPSIQNSNLDIARQYEVKVGAPVVVAGVTRNTWTVSARGTTRVPNGTPGGEFFTGLAMTYCYYPDS